ncbi:Alpha/Beta hydrolase protein [Kalaharituber pfeilii]|nr:Alpha/Beta hydrolase protein [Kalaharituber pfeilii]
MHIKTSIHLAVLSTSLLTPSVLVHAKPLPLFGIDLDGIVDKVKNGIDSLLSLGLGDIADQIKKDADELAAGLFPGSPGQPFPPELLPEITYMAEFASAVYCDGTHVTGTELVCKEQFCPTVSQNTVMTAATFANRGSADTTGVVALDTTTNSIVLSYRGSQSLRNWFANAQISLTAVPQYCPSCTAHTGFLDALNEEFPVVLSSIQSLTESHPDFQLVVVGHSLGGAIATLAATELRTRGFKPTLYTFGAPRVGNEALSKFISESGTNFRVTHLNDPVPRLPPLVLGYRHIEPEYHIFQGDTGIRPEDIKVFNGLVNWEGNTGFGGVTNFNTTAHRQYFLPVKFSGCDDADREGVEFR